jgi:hypothetical protein
MSNRETTPTRASPPNNHGHNSHCPHHRKTLARQNTLCITDEQSPDNSHARIIDEQSRDNSNSRITAEQSRTQLTLPASPWKSGPSGPRKKSKQSGALAPVFAFHAIDLVSNLLRKPISRNPNSKRNGREFLSTALPIPCQTLPSILVRS